MPKYEQTAVGDVDEEVISQGAKAHYENEGGDSVYPPSTGYTPTGGYNGADNEQYNFQNNPLFGNLFSTHPNGQNGAQQPQINMQELMQSIQPMMQQIQPLLNGQNGGYNGPNGEPYNPQNNPFAQMMQNMQPMMNEWMQRMPKDANGQPDMQRILDPMGNMSPEQQAEMEQSARRMGEELFSGRDPKEFLGNILGPNGQQLLGQLPQLSYGDSTGSAGPYGNDQGMPYQPRQTFRDTRAYQPERNYVRDPKVEQGRAPELEVPGLDGPDYIVGGTVDPIAPSTPAQHRHKAPINGGDIKRLLTPNAEDLRVVDSSKPWSGRTPSQNTRNRKATVPSTTPSAAATTAPSGTPAVANLATPSALPAVKRSPTANSVGQGNLFARNPIPASYQGGSNATQQAVPESQRPLLTKEMNTTVSNSTMSRITRPVVRFGKAVSRVVRESASAVGSWICLLGSKFRISYSRY